MEGCYLSRLQSAEDMSHGLSTCFHAALPLSICSPGPSDFFSDQEGYNAEHIAFFSLKYQMQFPTPRFSSLSFPGSNSERWRCKDSQDVCY